MIVAHRGDSSNAPENTIASISLAASTADFFEFDVRTTSDGQLVLMHDGTVDRTTDGTGPVTSFTLAQIQTLDAGSWFSPQFAGEPVPTFAEAIQTANTLGIQPMINDRTKNGESANLS